MKATPRQLELMRARSAIRKAEHRKHMHICTWCGNPVEDAFIHRHCQEIRNRLSHDDRQDRKSLKGTHHNARMNRD